MKLLTKAIEKKIKPLYTYENTPSSEVPIAVKFFTPDANWTWYVTEGDKEGDDWLFFGYVEGFEGELGYFRLSELKSIRGPLGLPVERDMYFGKHTLEEVMQGVARNPENTIWKVYIRAVGEVSWNTNDLEFDSEDEAEEYARDLSMKWMGMDRYEIIPFDPDDDIPYRLDKNEIKDYQENPGYDFSVTDEEGFDWFVKVIDRTHIKFGSSPEALEGPMNIYHIGELRGEIYYDDIANGIDDYYALKGK